MEMTATMMGYSGLFMGFAWQVQPRNMLLFACHAFNITAQANQMRRAVEYKLANEPNSKDALLETGKKVAGGTALTAALIAASGPLKVFFSAPAMPSMIKDIITHPAGPLTVFFWAPTSKWLFSVKNLKDLEKPTDTIR